MNGVASVELEGECPTHLRVEFSSDERCEFGSTFLTLLGFTVRMQAPRTLIVSE